jgi:hypothetical protein
MKIQLKHLLLLALVGAAVFLSLRWPRLNDVETGKAGAYPDLVPRSFAADGPQVFGAAKMAVERLPGWKLGGSGFGPAGWTVQAEHKTLGLPLRQEVTIRIRRVGGETVVNVRSRSLWGKWDFGQNARNVRGFLHALDEALFL